MMILYSLVKTAAAPHEPRKKEEHHTQDGAVYT